MTDWRHLTGTQRLQALWALVALTSFLSVVLYGSPVLDQTITAALIGAVGILGLLVLGLRERRHWNAMVAASTFEREHGTRAIDLEKLYRNRSVYVTTMVPHLLAQTHVEVSTRISGVDAKFTITLAYAGENAADRGVQTGVEALDEAFIIEGAEQNVSQVLSRDVKLALLDVETPGTCTITNREVAYVVPFTRMRADELEAIADVVVEIADQIEAVATGTDD